MKKQIFLIILLGFVLTNVVTAQGWNIELLDTKYTTWYEAEVIAHQGDYVYLGFYNYSFTDVGIAVIDISDVENPMEVGYYDSPGEFSDIEIDGNYAYVGYIGEGLKVLDISIPSNPIEIFSSPTPMVILDIFIQGDIAYITRSSGGLTIADISDPADIRFLSEFYYGDVARAVYVNGDIAYLSGADLLRIIDVSDPYNQILINTLGLPGDPYDFDLYEGYLYAALWDLGLHIYDVSDPINPVFTGSTGCDAYDIIVSDDIAYMRSQGDQLSIFDVSQPATPAFLGLIGTNHIMEDLVLAGDYILAAFDQYGLKAIDVSNPSVPVALPAYEPDWQIKDVSLSGDYAFVVDDDAGLLVFDVSDPSNMIQVSFLNTIGGADAIDICGDYAYIDCAWDSLLIVDISNPLEPQVAAQINMEGFICTVDEEAERFYVSGNHQDMFIYDLSTPTDPHVIGYYYIQFGTWETVWFNDISVEGNLLYGIAYYYEPGEDGGPIGDSLLVLDISDPTNPEFVSLTNLGGYSTQIEVRDNLAYVGAASPMLSILDVSDPARPGLIGSLDYPGTAKDLELQYDYVYIQSSYDINLRVIDIANPAHPVMTGYYTTPHYPQGIAVGDEVIFAACWDHFESYDCDDAVWVKPGEQSTEPADFILHNAYPNPFNASTAISYQLLAVSKVNLTIYDITGREVFTLLEGYQSAGTHSVVFDAKDLTSGVYFARLEAGDFRQTRKMLLIK